jgi:hypothetical protein
MAPQVANPVRPTSIFGTTYVMYGALLRLRALDDEWAEIIQDDKWDDALEWPVYVRLEDVQIIERGVAEPLGYVTGAPEGTSKYIILDIFNRELILIEGVTPVLRTPVILNTTNTPRDISIMARSYLCRNMPSYPGVPYTYFLHGTHYLDSMGFAIHGSPWHLWSDTVRQRALMRRLTHGCINVPDWEIPIPFLDKPMRTDEFVFRWAGGFPNPGADQVYMNQDWNPVRVYGLNNMHNDIWGYTMPDSLIAARIGWKGIVHAVEDKAIDAPEVFFS